MAHNNIQYSEKYYDDVYEYRWGAAPVPAADWPLLRIQHMLKLIVFVLSCRHVVLPPEIAQHLPKNRLLAEVRCTRRRCARATPRPTHTAGNSAADLVPCV